MRIKLISPLTPTPEIEEVIQTYKADLEKAGHTLVADRPFDQAYVYWTKNSAITGWIAFYALARRLILINPEGVLEIIKNEHRGGIYHSNSQFIYEKTKSTHYISKSYETP